MTEETQKGAAPAETAGGEAAAETLKPLLDVAPAAGEAAKPAEKPADEAKPVEGPPEKYEPFALPDGMAFKDETLAEFTGLAKEYGLTQDKAQKLADLGAKIASEGQQRLMERVDETCKKWNEDLRNDKELGGSKEKLNESLAVAKKALDSFGSPALRDMLKDSAVAYNPEFIRLLVNVGKKITQDTAPLGGGAIPPKEKPLLERYAEKVYKS